MTQIVLTIPDEKVETFLAFINDLNYIKVEEFIVPEWQKKEVRKRLRALKADPSLAIPSKEARRRLNALKV